jgi:MerC mercury resistance protein
MSAETTSLAPWDRAGILVSSACAIHCALLPVLLGAVPALGLSHLLDERVEWLFIVTTGLIGGMTHLRAYRHNHRHVAPGAIFAGGFLLVLGTRFLLRRRTSRRGLHVLYQRAEWRGDWAGTADEPRWSEDDGV